MDIFLWTRIGASGISRQLYEIPALSGLRGSSPIVAVNSHGFRIIVNYRILHTVEIIELRLKSTVLL